MRNIKEYPLTIEECLKALEAQHTALANKRPIIIGDLRALILSTIYDYLLENRESFTKYITNK